MITRARAGLLLALVLTVAIVGTLGWMWWASRLPSSYSAMDMGVPDYGGGPAPQGSHHAKMSHGGMGHGAGTMSVTDLDTEPGRKADVVVELNAEQGPVRLASGRTVEGYSLNGTSPGPLIEATVGDLVEVRLHNESVRDGVALHWHGVDVPNAEDGVAGVTQDAVEVGEDHTYRWVAPDAGTYWYHSHQLSNTQVSGGLLGALVVHPRKPEGGVRDVVAVSHVYDGDQTVNGRSGMQRVVAEPGERVRVRVVNTDNGSLLVWTGSPFVLRAIDGSEVNRPTEVSRRSVDVPAGGRADLEVTVPRDGAPVRVEMLGEAALVIGPKGSSSKAVEQPDKTVDLLHYGSAASLGLDVGRPDRSFEYSIGRRPGFFDGKPGLWWSVNGHLYQDMPMFVVAVGDVVRVRISNHSGKVHPMHLHGHHAVVLSRNGAKATGSPWWFDSLDVRDGETYDVAFLADNPGIWMDHCHHLKHAQQGLVTHLMYEGVTTPYRMGDDSGNTPE